MTAAVYCRKSTSQDVADDQKSVARQIEHARAYARRKGWTVADEHVYVDDGISGAEFANRPGFLRLMNALKPRATREVRTGSTRPPRAWRRMLSRRVAHVIADRLIDREGLQLAKKLYDHLADGEE